MKRGQVTIFVILGLVLVLTVVLFFAFSGKKIGPKQTSKGEIDLDTQFSQCVEPSLRENIKLISRQGGYVSNKLNLTFQFTNENKSDIAYLCYQQNNYLPCINQQPMLISHIEKELKREISGEVESCFNRLVADLKSRNDHVVSNYRGFDLNLYSGRVVLTLNGEVSFEKSGAVSSHSRIRNVYYTKLYDLIVVAQEIISQEARFCNFEQVGFSLIYPEYSIHKFRTGESNLIYTVSDKKSQEFFRFVVRGCVIPPGF